MRNDKPVNTITAPVSDTGFLPVDAFHPPEDAADATEPLEGRLHLAATAMHIEPAEPLLYEKIGTRLDLFPAIAAGLRCENGRLLWESQNAIPGFEDRPGSSYWDVLLQPGRVWSVPDDDGWSRAAFPFALVNPLENESYNGLALFGYRAGEVTPVRFQIEQQTAPFILRDYLLGAGTAQASFVPEPVTVRASDSAVIEPWSELESKVGAAALQGFDAACRSDHLFASGIDYQGAFHLRNFDGKNGPWPYPAEARLGIWSVTKSAMAGVAALRLAQLCGDGVLDERIVDHVPELADAPGWAKVRLRHALSMATGIGSRLDGYSAQGLDDNGISPGYRSWYLAKSVADKLAIIAGDSIEEGWEPGTVFRYRDQDLFTVGQAMDRFSRKRLGRSLEDILRQDVYGLIGIGETTWTKTMEPGGAPGMPLWAIGYCPTLNDLVKIARLIHSDGRIGDEQILSPSLIRKIFAGGDGEAVSTEGRLGDVNCVYFLTFWCMELENGQDGPRFAPTMLGYGGNEVILLPNGVSVIRVAKELPPVTHDFSDLARLGLALAPVARTTGG